MSLNSTPSGERIWIAFFGCRNAGKSSLVNAVTGQDLSVVSEIGGTTTDPVKKAMELLPLGPVMIVDTPGFDDTGALGEKRVDSARKILRSCNIAVLVTDASRDLNDCENELISLFHERKIPYLTVKNKADLLHKIPPNSDDTVYTSALKKQGITELKNTLGRLYAPPEKQKRFVGDLISAGDTVVLVTPIDSAAPKGRLILPQQQAVRDVIDSGAVAVVTRETELEKTLSALKAPPALVITDSQVFGYVSKIVPESVPLTSFSILMARYKGFLGTAVKGAEIIDTLKDGDKVLISEGCTHHRQCEDIGTVKLPRWLKARTGAQLDLQWSSGGGFPQDLSAFKLVIHCGGCMLNPAEIEYRMRSAEKQGVPFTNYGAAIAYMNGILARSIAPIRNIE